jgi:hypothetical protein
MPAGRPSADPRTLYLLAEHLYQEFKGVQEGNGWRLVLDEQKFARLRIEKEKSARLSAVSVNRLKQHLDKQIELGYLTASEKLSRLREMTDGIEFSRRFAGLNAARDLSQKLVKIGQPEIIEALVGARTPDQIQKICEDAFMISHEKDGLTGEPIDVQRPAWPISENSELPSLLIKHSSEFIEATRDPRFPKSGRPTSRLKQLWFLSRALAGAVHGISVRTSINRIGSVRPDEAVQFSKRARSPRQARKKS